MLRASAEINPTGGLNEKSHSEKRFILSQNDANFVVFQQFKLLNLSYVNIFNKMVH